MVPKLTNGFRGVSLKKELIDAIEKFLNESPDAGYKNVAEFVSDATRRRIEEVKKIYVSSPSKKPQ